MNTTKFRGQILDGTRKGEWVYGYLLNFTGDDGNMGCYIFEDNSSEFYSIPEMLIEVDPNTVGLYTGMTETAYVGKTTKEIYEGDVLKYGTEEDGYREGLISYEEGKYGGYGLTLDGYDYCPAKSMLTKWKDIEIIGNIHDNPDLIT